MREALREHCAEHFPDVTPPDRQSPSNSRRGPWALPADTNLAVAAFSANSSTSPASSRTCRRRPSLVHRQHDAVFAAAAEVQDPRSRADTRQWSGGTEHVSMLARLAGDQGPRR